MDQKKVVFVLGAPGVGKGTQCRKIEKEFGFVHISAGELLRRERQTPDSHHGELIDNYINEGKIVPAEITCKLLEKEISSTDKVVFLIDGFPRNKENRDGWEKTLASKTEIMFVLFLDCPVEVCIQRCMNRGAAGGSGRLDDNMEILEKRINTYIVETKPTIDFYDEMNLLRRVDGNKHEDAVFEDVVALFESFNFTK